MKLLYDCHEKHHSSQTDEKYRMHWTCDEIEKKMKRQDAEHWLSKRKKISVCNFAQKLDVFLKKNVIINACNIIMHFCDMKNDFFVLIWAVSDIKVRILKLAIKV